MSFEMVIDKTVSLADLRQVVESGGSVVKTPHVGNHYLNNLLIARIVGALMLCYDRTIGIKDKNFHPHLYIVGGERCEVADPNCLTSHARVTRECLPYFPEGASLAECHMDALRKAVPEGRFVTYNQYLVDNRDLIMRILEVATRANPRVWERQVTDNGHASRIRGGADWHRAMSQGIYGLTNDHEGLLIPNILNVLMSGIVEAVNHRTDKVYHLSGPDMINYAKGMIPSLKWLYRQVRGTLTDLPKTIWFHLVPVAGVRLAVPESDRGALDHLVGVYDAQEQMKRERAEVFRGIKRQGRAARRELAGQFDQRERNGRAQLCEAVAVCGEAFYGINHGKFFSQYDLLGGNGHPCREFYVHPRAIEMSMAEIDVMMRQFTWARKKNGQA